MEIHKPKPIHNWRELAKEIGVIVVGILIALGLEQAIEAYHGKERAETSVEAFNSELGLSLAKARDISNMTRCSERQLAVLARAISAGDQRQVRTVLARAVLPSGSLWTSASWRAALSSDVSNHLDDRTRRYYSILFSFADVISEKQDRYIDAYGRMKVLATADLADSADVRNAELTQFVTMTAALRDFQDIADRMPQTAKNFLGLQVTPADLAARPSKDQVARCEAAAAVLDPSGTGTS